MHKFYNTVMTFLPEAPQLYVTFLHEAPTFFEARALWTIPLPRMR